MVKTALLALSSALSLFPEAVGQDCVSRWQFQGMTAWAAAGSVVG